MKERPSRPTRDKHALETTEAAHPTSFLKQVQDVARQLHHRRVDELELDATEAAPPTLKLEQDQPVAHSEVLRR